MFIVNIRGCLNIQIYTHIASIIKLQLQPYFITQPPTPSRNIVLGKEQCFQNWINHWTRKFTGLLVGPTIEPWSNQWHYKYIIYILLKFKIIIKNKNNNLYICEPRISTHVLPLDSELDFYFENDFIFRKWLGVTTYFCFIFKG